MKHRILVVSALALALAAVAPRALALNPDAEKPHVAAMTEGFLKYPVPVMAARFSMSGGITSR